MSTRVWDIKKVKRGRKVDPIPEEIQKKEEDLIKLKHLYERNDKALEQLLKEFIERRDAAASNRF